MTVLYILSGALLFAALLTLTLAYITYRITFHSPDHKQNDIFYIPFDNLSPERRGRMEAMIQAFSEVPYESVRTTSFDSLSLAARYIHVKDGAPIAICCHGYRGTSIRDFCGGGALLMENGYNLLLIDQRGCRDSEGHVITFGIKESRDVFTWIDYLKNRFGEDVRIALVGVSMGASTVLLASGMGLPDNVRHVIADCPFSSPKEIISEVCRKDHHIPPRLAMPFLSLGARLFAGIDLNGGKICEAVRQSPVEILLIHGEADAFVPIEMSRHIAAQAPDRITLHPFPHAEHALSYTTDKERYRAITRDYLEKDRRIE